MRKTKKQLLGLASLVAVAIMTAVAYAMPTPAAAAEEDPVALADEPSYSAGVNVQVRVGEAQSSGRTYSPANNSTSTNGKPEVATDVSNALGLRYGLRYRKDSDTPWSDVDLGANASVNFTSDNDTGTYRFNLDLGLNFGEYQLTTTIIDQYNNSRVTDITTFYYRALLANFDKGINADRNPILTVDTNEAVETVGVNVYDKNGDPVFLDKDGKEVTITLKRSDIDPKTGEITKALPFKQYDAPKGEYTVVISGYDSKDSILSMVVLPVTYDPNASLDPNAPDVPNAGLTLSDLNISRADYLVTGLVVFGLVAGFAVYLVARKSKSRR